MDMMFHTLELLYDSPDFEKTEADLLVIPANK
jgi:hypothetical protein